MMSNKKAGVILQYMNTFISMMVSIFFTPFLIRTLGSAEYGVYKIIQSFSSQLIIMNFGISTLVVRNIVYSGVSGEKKEKENFLFMTMTISYILGAIVIAIGAFLYFGIDNIYANSFTAEEIVIAKKLFALLVLNIAITIISDTGFGIIRAHEKFVVSSGVQVIRQLIRIIVLVVLLKMGVKSIGIVLTDLSLSVCIYIFVCIYSRFKLKEKIKFHYFDKKAFKLCMTFSFAIVLQSIVNQVNQNVDNIILGIMTSPQVVTIYSVALTLYVTFNSVTITVASVFSPSAIKLVAKGASGEELTDFVVRIGRIQFMIAGAVIAGFALFGKNFLHIWVGPGFEDVYKITLILITPVVIPLIENITNAILDAMLKRMFRSLVLVLMAVLNVIFSVVLIKYVGYIGAAYGTALSLIIGHGIILNIYFKKVIGLNIKRLFLDTFKGTIKAIVVATIVCLPLTLLAKGWITFACQIGIFVCVYVALMYYFGMNKNEKALINKPIKKLLKK